MRNLFQVGGYALCNAENDVINTREEEPLHR
jgi:hypothetical protein